MSRKDNRQIKDLVWGLTGMAAVGLAVGRLEPGNWLTETAVVLVAAASEFLICKWLFNKNKPAIVLTVITIGGLVLKRLAILDVLTGLLLAVIALLISLA